MALFGTGDATKYWRASVAQPDMGGRTSSVSTSTPIWVSVWQRGAVASPASNQGLASWGNVGNTASAGPYIDTGGNFFAWDRNDAGSFQQSAAWLGSVANTWQHIVAYYPTTSLRQIYGAGTFRTQDANALASPQTFNMLQVGRVSSATALTVSTNRSVAEVVFGRGVLSSGQIGALAQGASPLDVLSPTQIVAYFPLRDGFDDFGPQRTALVPIGGPAAVWGAHPAVATPRRRRAAFAVIAPTRPRRPFVWMAA